MKLFGLKHLKIIEQIAIVVCIAVVAPMSVSGFIINNINQQAVRSQLKEAAILTANIVSDEIDFFSQTINTSLAQVSDSLKYIPKYERKKYLDNVAKTYDNCEKIEIVKNKAEYEQLHEINKKNEKVTISTSLYNGELLVATYSLGKLRDEVFHSLKDDLRQIYIMTNDGALITGHNYTDTVFKDTLALMPKELKVEEPVIFGDVKNQPLVYLKKLNPPITIIVNTTEKLTDKLINKNRAKIIWSIIFATLIVIFIVGLYTYYLYINIRQLFKGIIAISKGNYERQIRLFTTAFTPHEIIFLAFEFNRMASEIHKSYLQLKRNNIELKQLNEFRSNLIDTVSHELRTPLTSIQGYTSRLMRQDINIDEETKQKSLRVIKDQSERLKRLIEDLLTIPDIEGMKLKTNVESVWLPEVMETAKFLVKNKDNKEIEINIEESFPNVIGDKNRLEQVFVNLIENAVKYAYPETKITVNAVAEDNVAKIYVKNQCDVIPKKKLNTLFEKFIRLDNNTTRTTRGTGLGLFIVKGLVDAMNGEITLSSDEKCGFCVEVILKLVQDEELLS
ncbi:MAG: HAMP domain-containing sensor histidine kinase [Candidatus Gastranaerophilaceae bacterium]|nr:HAMP domain-containing sensor histidine kinase [Candidatus Gastranaerophilaceae bacterium]